MRDWPMLAFHVRASHSRSKATCNSLIDRRGLSENEWRYADGKLLEDLDLKRTAGEVNRHRPRPR